MSINVSTQADGTVVVRSSTGQLLVGYGGAATLAYTPSVSAHGPGHRHLARRRARPSTLLVGDGELQGLLSLRNTIIPGVQEQLSQYVSGAVSAINAVHNANTAVPPPQTLTGRNTGLDLPTVVGDFTGKTNIAIVDSNSQLQQQVAIDFSADTMSVNGGAATSFTPATFLTSLNTALGGAGDGQLHERRAQHQRHDGGLGRRHRRRRDHAVAGRRPGLQPVLRPERPGHLERDHQLQHRPEGDRPQRLHARRHDHLPDRQRRGHADHQHPGHRAAGRLRRRCRTWSMR